MKKVQAKRRGLGAFLRGNRGSITIEFVIWMPVFLAILGIMTDAATMYIRQANMWNVARDAARGMATGQFTACTSNTPTSGATTDARAFALGQLLFGGRHYTVSCWFPTGSANATATSCVRGSSTTNASNNDIVQICIPIQYAGIFGILAVFGGLAGTSFNVQVSMLSET